MQIGRVGWPLVNHFLVLNYFQYRLLVRTKGNGIVLLVCNPDCRAAVRVCIGSEDLATLRVESYECSQVLSIGCYVSAAFIPFGVEYQYSRRRAVALDALSLDERVRHGGRNHDALRPLLIHNSKALNRQHLRLCRCFHLTSSRKQKQIGCQGGTTHREQDNPTLETRNTPL